jgi:Ca2+-binding RTX toxin-like protein
MSISAGWYYIVDQSGDAIKDARDGGFDTLVTSTSFSLGSDLEIELLKFADLASKTAQNLSGSASSNTLFGSAGTNILKGYGGNDAVKGDAGNDRLYGGLGNDTLYGGAGLDRLYGERGREIFVFDSRPSKANLDRIYSYKVNDDSIYLDNAIFTKLGKGTPTKPQKLKAGMFALGSKAQDSSDRILYDKKSGALYYDKDGYGGAAKVQFATLDKNLKITAAEFFVI